MLTWALFALAGDPLWSIVPLCLAAVVLTAMERPRVFGGSSVLDASLVASLVAIALQLVPLPTAWRLFLSPVNVALIALEGIAKPSPSLPPDAVPLTLNPAGTVVSLCLAVTLVLTFWCARSIFHRGQLRTTVRWIAWTGLLLAAMTMVLRALSPVLVYGIFPPVSKTQTFGPFVSRNDFASWNVMALPLVLGYAVTRMQAHVKTDGTPIDVEEAVDDLFLWLAASIGLMAAVLVLAASRSGLIGVSAALVLFVVLTRRQASGRNRWVLVGALVGLVIFALSYGNFDRLAARLGETMDKGLGERPDIWAMTIALAKDFPWVGVGAGAYEHAMLLYQPAPHLFYYNEAHNEYLQLAAEGGVLVCVPLLVALVAAVSTLVRRLAQEDGAVVWTRAGAVAAMAGIAVQSIWETGLRMPANGVLFAVAAAVAMYPPHGRRHHRRHREPWQWSAAPEPGRQAADDAIDIPDW